MMRKCRSRHEVGVVSLENEFGIQKFPHEVAM